MLPRPVRPPPPRHAWLALAALIAAWPMAGRAGAGFEEDVRRERMLYEAREEEAAMLARGVLYGDPALDAYLQSVMDRLFPEFRGHGRVRALASSEANAFAVASGNVYVYAGMLLRLRDEAELAAVLGHEGGHVEGDHLFLSLRVGQNTARGEAIARAVTAAARGPLLRFSTETALSRELERDADWRGFGRMKAAGYETAAGARTFERDAREIAARGLKEPPYAYADHPLLSERATTLARLAAEAPGGERRADEYRSATRTVRLATLRAVHAQGEGPSLVALLEDDGQAAEYAPEGDYLLGEGYRLRAQDGDLARALAQYDRSIATHPECVAAYYARARVRARQGDRAGAIADLEQFLAEAADSRDVPFARQSLERLRSTSR